MPRIHPFLWFDTQAEEAISHYVSVFPNSRITAISRYGAGGPGPAGSVMTIACELDGQPLAGLNGGPHFTFNEAVSFVVDCADQAEIDYYWERLGDGGVESQCGWLKDRFGLSWQIVPIDMASLISHPDPARAGRAVQAMLGMKKLDIAALRAARDG